MPPKPKLPRFASGPHDPAEPSAREVEMRFLDAVYREANGGAAPSVLREDFCGAFAGSCAWVKLGPERRAIGIDSDLEQLGYGCAHYRARLKPSQLVRVQVLRDDVRGSALPQADVIAALGFSCFAIKTRPDLLAYFRDCLGTLEPGGVLALDCFGGSLAQQAHEESHEAAGATYVVEYDDMDVLTHESEVRIRLKRRGELKGRMVSTLDWRLWTLPELKDTLLDAGFVAARVYWQADPHGDEAFGFAPGEGIAEEPSSWTSYVFGFRS